MEKQVLILWTIILIDLENILTSLKIINGKDIIK